MNDQTSELLQAILAKLDRGNANDRQWPDHNGDYWSLSPFRADSHVGSFSVNLRGFYDFASNEGGSLYELAKRLGVIVPAGALGLTLVEYADAKKLPLDFLKSLGLSNTTETRQGALVPIVLMPYKDESGAVAAVRKRQALRKPPHGKDNRFIWRKGDAEHLIPYGLWRLADMRAAGWVLLVEGESDCHTAWLHGLPAIGVPGAKNWRPEWARYVEGLEVYVWQEPDPGGETFVSRMAGSLPRAQVITPPDGVKDLSAIHIAGQDLPAVVAELRERATPIGLLEPSAEEIDADSGGNGEQFSPERTLQALNAKKLADLEPWVRRRLSKRTTREDKLKIGQAIASWLLERQRLLVDLGQDAPKGGRPYLVADDGALWPLERDLIPTRLTLHAAGLNATESAYNFVLEELAMAAYKHGQRATLARWQTSRGGTIYVSSGACHIVRAVAGQLETLPNGADGVWFAGDLCYPTWAPTDAKSPFDLPAFNPALQAPAEVRAYTPEVQRDLLAVYLASLPSGIRPLPLLGAYGDKGGGKSILTKAIMRTLLGPTAEPVTLSEDRRDFWTLITSGPVIALDNVDADSVPWLADQLAAAVTGVNIEKRELYSDNNKISRPVTAAIAISTRTMSFARPDVAERTLPLVTSEFADSKREADSDLLAQVDAARDGLMTWCALKAAELLTYREQAPRGLPLRFVDFARMTWAYFKAQGREGEAGPALQALRQAQALTIGEADPLIEAVTRCFDAMTSTSGHWQGTPADLVRALKEAGADLPFMGGGKRIARQLREGKATLTLMGIQLAEDNGSGRTAFTLRRAESTEKAESGVSCRQHVLPFDRSISRKVLQDSVVSADSAGKGPTEPCPLCGHTDWIWTQANRWACASCPQNTVRSGDDPQQEAERAGAVQVPVMITRRMEQELREAGCTDDEIKRMKPEEAWSFLLARREKADREVEELTV